MLKASPNTKSSIKKHVDMIRNAKLRRRDSLTLFELDQLDFKDQ